MRVPARVALIAPLALILPALAAEPCMPEGAQALESPRYTLAYRTRPDVIPAHAHFAMSVVVCPKPGAGPPEALRVDARMPEHRHGMNYRPSVRESAPGRYEVDGMMFHMTGRWELVFEIRADGRTDRIAQMMELR